MATPWWRDDGPALAALRRRALPKNRPHEEVGSVGMIS